MELARMRVTEQVSDIRNTQLAATEILLCEILPHLREQSAECGVMLFEPSLQ
jgi:hypothetical protein